MKTIETSRHFDLWRDPVSGIETYVLKGETAPFHQTIYFVAASTTKDGRYFWFYCAFPPLLGSEGSEKSMAVLDLYTDEIYYHPDIQPAGTPMVDQDSGELYWPTANYIFKKGPHPKDAVTKIAKIPSDMRRLGGRVASHMTFSPDKSEIFCDVSSGNYTFLSTVNVKTGIFSVWHKSFGGWNHAQINPVDGDLALYAMDFWVNISTSIRNPIGRDEENKITRLWTIRRGEDPVHHKAMFEQASHEYWSANGKRIYYCDKDRGTCSVDIETGERKLVHPEGYRHSYMTADEKYCCADIFLYDEEGQWYRGCPTRVNFHNTVTGKTVDIVTENPALYKKSEPCVYHIDPHPRFVFNDEYVAFTTTVHGRVDVAFTKVSQLIKATGGEG